MKDSSAWTVLAHLLRPQGRKGELLAELLTDFPERFEDQRRVYLAAPEFSGAVEEARSAEVTAFWLPVGKNGGRIVLQLAGIASISGAESVAGMDVLIPAEERLPLDDDAVYISELIGCTVFDGQNAVGVVEDVQFPASADGARRLPEAAPLLTVKSAAGDEVLIPFVKAFLVSMDLGKGRIEMQLPEGLVEVNRAEIDPASDRIDDQKR